MKKLGQPTALASPWSDRNVSVMRSRAAAGMAEGSADTALAALRADAVEARPGLHGRRGTGELLHDAVERRACRDGLFQLELAVARLQERIGCLARSGILAHQALESGERRSEVPAHVVRL